ncbi:MAG TPA: ABC transporter permease, partial [Gemmatimonadales bacterium]|nr:ABC transporter permease [Gemmatimonadales bacterium]
MGTGVAMAPEGPASLIGRVQQRIGETVLDTLASVGRFAGLVAEIARGVTEVRTWVPRTFAEAHNIGVGSLPIVLLISAFAGGVTALQAGYQFTGNIPIYVVGAIVTQSIVLELGPVLVGLI